MGEMEMWQRCLWALRLEVEPSIASDVEKRVTEKIDALTREVAGLRAVINRALQDIPERYFWHTVEYLRAALSATTDTKETKETTDG